MSYDNTRLTSAFHYCTLSRAHIIIEPRREKTGFLPMRKQRRRSASQKPISAFVFVTRIVQFLFFVNPKFLASSLLLNLYRPVCVRPGRKPRRPVFSRRGSYCALAHSMTRFLHC